MVFTGSRIPLVSGGGGHPSPCGAGAAAGPGGRADLDAGAEAERGPAEIRPAGLRKAGSGLRQGAGARLSHRQHAARDRARSAAAGAGGGGGRVFGSTEDIPGLLRALADGGKLLRFGVADHDFYRLFSEAVQHAQDNGQTTLVVCPDGTGEEVGQALASITRFFSPEITQRWLRLTRLTQVYTGRVPYDVILVEEHQFHEVLVANGQDFALSLQRTRLVVLIDFHAVDACRLNLGLARLQRHLDLQSVAVLCVSRRRVGLEEQVSLLFPGREGKSGEVQEFTTRPNPAQRFQICWREGPDFRARLRSLGALTEGPKLDSSVYLSIVGADEALPVAVLADRAVNTLGDFENLGDLLESKGQSDVADRLAATLRLTHYAPPQPVRISIVQDTGNLADAVGGRYDFFHAGEDRLIHVVSWPYPARDFAFDWLGWGPESFASDAIPFAQKPDIGLTELAIRIENALREADGLDEPELMSLLSRASGDLPKDLGLTATRRGLIGLFKSIDPDFRETAIRHETAADQTHRFHLDPAYRVSGITHMAEVVEGGARIGELSPRDEGLTYARDAQIYLNGSFHRVERIEQDDRRVVVTPVSRTAVEHGRRSQNLFQRTYALDLKRFAREQEKGEHLGRSSRLYRMHVHATITRSSDLHLVWPLDEPLLSGATRANPSTVGIVQVRPYRGIYLIAMRSDSAQAAATFSPIVRRTLSASLQDILGFLFPALTERIAVVEIGGEPAFDTAPNYARLAFRYPRATRAGDTRRRCRAHGVSPRAARREPPELGEGWAGADLAVIEDADGDLGVVRRLHDNWPDLVAIWKRYLAWGAEQPLWQPEEGLFDAASALKLPIFGGEP